MTLHSSRLIATAATALAIALATVGCAGPAARLQPGRSFPSQPTRTTEVNFVSLELGKTPADFRVEQTGVGDPASWLVVADPTQTRRVLGQTSADAVNKQRFPLCIYEPLSLRNVEASVRFKPISGKVDQSGGVIVRYQDKNNYYVLRTTSLRTTCGFTSWKRERGS